MKYIIIFIVIVVLTGAVFWWNKGEVLAPDTQLPQQESKTEGDVSDDEGPSATVKGHTIELEIARTPEEQALGLSGRAQLADNAGMLFVYDQPVIPGFWMPDMNFSIDIIWIDENGKIIAVSENITPETYPQTFSPPAPITYALEVNAGWAKRHNISIGNEVVLSFDMRF